MIKDKLFFFASDERRKIERAPHLAFRPRPIRPGSPTRQRELRGPRPARPERGEASLRLAGPQHGNQPVPVHGPNKQDTRQDVLRIDYYINPKWRLMARYTHDLSATTEAGGLFFGTAIPTWPPP